MVSKNEDSFTISVVGDNTGEKMFGLFKCKVRLALRDTITKDQIYRDFCLKSPGTPSQAAHELGIIFSELAIRLTESPAWWTGSNNGLDLEDENVVHAVFKAAIKCQEDYKEKIKKEAEKAAEELKKE